MYIMSVKGFLIMYRERKCFLSITKIINVKVVRITIENIKRNAKNYTEKRK